MSSTRMVPGDGSVKITVQKVSGSEIQLTVSADIRVSGDLAHFLAGDARPGARGT